MKETSSAAVGAEALGILAWAMESGAKVRSIHATDGLLYSQLPNGAEFLFMFPPVTAGEFRVVEFPPKAGRSLTRWDGIALTLVRESLSPPPEPKLDKTLKPYPIFANPLRQTWRIEPHTDYILAGFVEPGSDIPQIDQITDLLEATWHTTMNS
jgi:hypothetical protein